jgi:hypothetical protein
MRGRKAKCRLAKCRLAMGRSKRVQEQRESNLTNHMAVPFGTKGLLKLWNFLSNKQVAVRAKDLEE